MNKLFFCSADVFTRSFLSTTTNNSGRWTSKLTLRFFFKFYSRVLLLFWCIIIILVVLKNVYTSNNNRNCIRGTKAMINISFCDWFCIFLGKKMLKKIKSTQEQKRSRNNKFTYSNTHSTCMQREEYENNCCCCFTNFAFCFLYERRDVYLYLLFCCFKYIIILIKLLRPVASTHLLVL